MGRKMERRMEVGRRLEASTMDEMVENSYHTMSQSWSRHPWIRGIHHS